MAKQFTESHEWIETEGAVRRVGITDFAQNHLGDIVFIDFPMESGERVAVGDEVCIIESCKATASVYAPVGGTLKAVNNALEDAPQTVNQSPEDEGWLFAIEPDGDVAGLFDEAAYRLLCSEEE